MRITKIISIISVMLLAATAYAQQPVKWNYSAKKIGAKKYEIHLTATIDEGWHLYSQKQPEDAIALPTTISFTKNPFIRFEGKVQEKGELKKVKEETLGVVSWQYMHRVSFVQVIELKSDVKTSVNGNIEFQACTDEMCLPPATINFSIAMKE